MQTKSMISRCALVVAWSVFLLCTASAAASPASATQYGYVTIFCNNYPEYDRDGKLLNGDSDGKVAPNCTYYSNVFVAHLYPDLGRSGPFPPEAREEEQRIKERARDAFEVQKPPCQRMVINVVAGAASEDQATERRQTFLNSSERKADCVKTFNFYP